MADNVAIVGAGTAATIGTETKTINSIAVQVQEVAPALGGRDLYVGSQGGRQVDGATDTAAGYVDPRLLAKNLTANPTIATSAYVTGYCLGGLLTFATANRASGGSLLIANAKLSDKSKQSAAVDLIIFDTNPTGSTFTDHAALNIVAADLPFIAGVIQFTAAGYSVFSATSVCGVGNLGLEVLLAATSLYGVMCVRGTPTYAGANDLDLKLVIIQD